jgi:hypothetical protein
MNEEALQYSFELFKADGYNGSIEDYKSLINSNQEALDYSYSLFNNDGYNGSLDDFSSLIGVGVSEEDVKKKEQPEPTQTVQAQQTEPVQEAPLPGLGGVSEEPTPSPSVGQGVLRDVDQTQSTGEEFITGVSDLTRTDVREPQVDNQELTQSQYSFKGYDIDSSKYETKLSKDEESKFQNWLTKQHNLGNITDGDYRHSKEKGYGYNYDFRAAFKENMSSAINEVDDKPHWGDIGKKPNHPTFSNESKYHNVDGYVGGSWDGENYTPPQDDVPPQKGGAERLLGIINEYVSIPDRINQIDESAAELDSLSEAGFETQEEIDLYNKKVENHNYNLETVRAQIEREKAEGRCMTSLKEKL